MLTLLIDGIHDCIIMSACVCMLLKKGLTGAFHFIGVISMFVDKLIDASEICLLEISIIMYVLVYNVLIAEEKLVC